MSWVEQLLTLTDDAESPKSFVYWSGLATISAVVKDSVWIEKGGIYKLYPSIYVLIIGKSGLRKGFPIKLAEKLVGAVDNTRIISGRSSIQGIIKALSLAKIGPNGTIINDGSCFINAGEFATSLVRDPDALTILTDLYDRHYNMEWKNTLKGSPVELIKNPTITLLGALNPAHFHNMITDTDMQGGFIARCLLVIATKRHKKNSLLRTKMAFKWEELVEYLVELTNLKGPFKIEEEAVEVFEEWYYAYEPELMRDKTGTANRMHDHILKAAMLISLSNTPNLIITAEDMKGAMEACLQFTSNADQVSEGIGKSPFAFQTKLILDLLLGSEDFRMSRRQILEKLRGDLDHISLDNVVEYLSQRAALTIESERGIPYYQLTKKTVELYTKFTKKD